MIALYKLKLLRERQKNYWFFQEKIYPSEIIPLPVWLASCEVWAKCRKLWQCPVVLNAAAARFLLV